MYMSKRIPHLLVAASFVISVLLIFITVILHSDRSMDDVTGGSGVAEIESVTSPAVEEFSVDGPDEYSQVDVVEENNQQYNDISPVEESLPAEISESGAASAGVFAEYSQSALMADGTNILFFHADWCPSCRNLERDLITNRADIPADVTILKLNYDTETELKQKYGVIRQHTLVVVDGEGNELKKLNGLTNTLQQVVNQL